MKAGHKLYLHECNTWCCPWAHPTVLTGTLFSVFFPTNFGASDFTVRQVELSQLDHTLCLLALTVHLGLGSWRWVLAGREVDVSDARVYVSLLGSVSHPRALCALGIKPELGSVLWGSPLGSAPSFGCHLWVYPCPLGHTPGFNPVLWVTPRAQSCTLGHSPALNPALWATAQA